MNTIDKPLVSVIIPAWNAERWITETVSSAINQTWKQLEIIVVDDGSSDSTAKVVAETFPSVRVICQANSGQAAARNTGVAAAKGKFLAFLDADDVWLPEKIEAQMRIILTDPSISLVFCDYESFGLEVGKPGFQRGPILSILPTKSIGEFAKLITADNLLIPLLQDMFCQVPSFWLTTKDYFTMTGGFDNSLRKGGEDWLFAVNLGNIGRFAYDSRRLAKRREHLGSHSRSNNEFIGLAQAMMKIISNKNKFPPLFISLVNRRLAYSCLYIGQANQYNINESSEWLVKAIKYSLRVPIKDSLKISLRAILLLSILKINNTHLATKKTTQ